VKHWIDLGRLSMRSAAGRVYVRGTLERIYGNTEKITPTLVDTIFTEIKRVKGVKGVTPDLDNWTNEAGAWKPAGQPDSKKKRDDSDRTSGTGGTYDIDDS
ncbi:hypothetical protein BVX94_00010, partial [bacterium B17]